MTKRIRFLSSLIGGFCCFFFSCLGDLSLRPEDRPPIGMKKIESNGKTFFQGTNDSLASIDEKPGMNSSFTYDFWIDSTEVTQSRFFELTGRRPVSDTSPYGAGERYPVYYVTWFDAVLFCNARSKLEKRDTVYSYTGKQELANGMVYGLTGLHGDLSRYGYRLPTEAEWEYSALGGAQGPLFNDAGDSAAANDQAWYAANASNRVHPVALKKANGFGLFDMAGNVFEWTNDWKGMYKGQSISNSLGALQPDNDFEKVIKGGSFNFSLNSLRPSCRSATYATTLSAANEYVGFRCAFGPVTNGSYIGIGQVDFIPNPVFVTLTNGEARSFAGTSGSRLVFVNVTGPNRTLCFVDFNKTFPQVMEYLDDKKVYMPVLSPNGRYVAYCSANEGQFGPSTITIRSLDSLSSPRVVLSADTAYIPRWWIDPLGGDTCIIYTNSAVANSSPLWRSSKTCMQKIAGGMPSGAPSVLSDNGGYHDGRSADGNYLLSAYDRLMVRDRTQGTERQIFVFPENGKDTTGSAQVCNASLSPDTGSSVRCLFLDFGSPAASTITGERYGIHEVMFVSSLGGTVTDFMHCPAGEKSWDFCEWSNQSRYAVSCARSSAGQAHAVYLVDWEKHVSVSAVKGTELQQPGWWIRDVLDAPFVFPMDSIGCYNDPPVDGIQGQFAFMMHYFWNDAADLDMVFFGHSQMIAGVDCTRFTDLRARKIAFNFCGLSVTTRLINSYVFVHTPKVRVIGINLPLYFFNKPGGELEPTWWDRTIGASKGFAYDRDHNFWRDSIPDGFYQAIVRAPFPERPDQDTNGLALWSCEGWGGSEPDLNGWIDWTVDDSNYLKNFAALEQLIKTVSERKIHLISIIFPESPFYRSTTHYTRYGPSRETGRKVVEQVRGLESTYPYFHLYDANSGGDHDYSDQEVRDWNHLCRLGAAKLTDRLDSLVHVILAKE